MSYGLARTYNSLLEDLLTTRCKLNNERYYKVNRLDARGEDTVLHTGM